MPKSANPTDKHVGSRLRMRRLMLGMSQAYIADAVGVTFQQVQKYEKGTNRVSASRLQHLSQILQVPVPFFFEGAPAASRHPASGKGDGCCSLSRVRYRFPRDIGWLGFGEGVHEHRRCQTASRHRSAC